jgi:hypothetical protein
MVSQKNQVHKVHGRTSKDLARGFLAFSAISVALGSFPQNAEASGVIKRPGAHNRYDWELEPQLVVRTNIPYWNGGNGNWTGFGPGVRASIPFVHNGPIDSINNNIAISFGGSMTWHGNNTRVTVLNLPVAFQWNFYFTEIVSVLGEAGLNTPVTFGRGGNAQFDVEPFIQGGGRFQWDKVGVVVRLGYPSFSVGANFQF